MGSVLGMQSVEKSLKAINGIKLVSVLTANALLLAMAVIWPVVGPSWQWNDTASLRAALAVFLPLAVLLLNSLVPASIKAVLVFWRVRHALPGHRAFSWHAVHDPRIDVDRLRRNVGAFPAEPRAQNTLWYRLFKLVEQDVLIDHVHGQFLRMRAAIPVLIADGRA